MSAQAGQPIAASNTARWPGTLDLPSSTSFSSNRLYSESPNSALGAENMGSASHSGAGGRPMTAPDQFSMPLSMHPSFFGPPDQATPTSTPADPVLMAPQPHRARNFSLPDNSLLSLPDEPNASQSIRPATSGSLPATMASTSGHHMNLPPTLASMPGYAYGAAMLAESNARKAHDLQHSQNPALAAAMAAAAANPHQRDVHAYPFSQDSFPPGTADTDSSSRPGTANRPDTGCSYTSTSTVGGSQPLDNQIGTTTIGSDGRVYQFIGVTTQHKKRARRKYDEIERMYACNWPGCTKSYGCLNHLNAHVMTQKHGPKRLPAEFKEMRKEWRAKKKAEENAKKAEEEERKRNGIKSPEPEPAQGGPIIPPAAAALLQQQQQQHSNTAAQLIYRPLTDGPGSMQGMATSMPISTTGQRPESANPFAFQPPPLSAHHAYAQHEAPNGNSLYHPYIPLDPHAQASAAMRPSTAPSQFAFYPPYPPPNAAAAVAAANPRPTSSSMFSFQAPEASEAMQSFGNIAGQHNPPSPNHSVSIFGGHGISPGSGSPPTSLAEGARRFSLPQQQPVPPLSSLHGIPEDSQPSFISDTRSPSDPGAHQPSANTPAWMEPPNGGGRSASTPVPPQWLDVNSQRTGSTAPTPQSDWTLPGSPPNEHKTEPPSIF